MKLSGGTMPARIVLDPDSLHWLAGHPILPTRWESAEAGGVSPPGARRGCNPPKPHCRDICCGLDETGKPHAVTWGRELYQRR